MQYKNLILIGTSHISPEAATKVQESIQTHKPAIVALELDNSRLYALLNPNTQKISWRDISRIGIQGSMFAFIAAWAEKTLGKQIGTKPGIEMLTAYITAQQIGSRVALIDQEIQQTLKRIRLTWKERWNVFVDIVKAVVLRKSIVTFDLRAIPNDDVIHQLVTILKKRYPTLHKTLVAERNYYMAKQIVKLMNYEKEKLIIAVMGAGHIKEVMNLVKKYINTTTST